ncbi:hypothetical protein [Cytobacillus horneckiae]|uniref:Uncharacterized protein n=1 Tax=Cytobacillus horneckiae TaxID=549687 RepID=A0A2N0ZFH0_9BACI|nr:hypothetical protein [Cytobacillus horneckiae]MEC1154269.1 hypothetical protein [Cytobacillus horneckiae]MED2937605.1 hypothetical protein [Cytobacillus horneckiae]PKG28255.1 hypothetical protein CWS20_13670 [Cytobacillus horneckiae]
MVNYFIKTKNKHMKYLNSWNKSTAEKMDDYHNKEESCYSNIGNLVLYIDMFREIDAIPIAVTKSFRWKVAFPFLHVEAGGR